jgi:hypothetical protein
LKTISIPKNSETFGIPAPYSIFLTESTCAQKKPLPEILSHFYPRFPDRRPAAEAETAFDGWFAMSHRPRIFFKNPLLSELCSSTIRVNLPSFAGYFPPSAIRSPVFSLWFASLVPAPP